MNRQPLCAYCLDAFLPEASDRVLVRMTPADPSLVEVHRGRGCRQRWLRETEALESTTART